MERNIGEKFEYENTILEVTETEEEYDCSGCYLENIKNGGCSNDNFELTGECTIYANYGKINIIFKEVD